MRIVKNIALAPYRLLAFILKIALALIVGIALRTVLKLVMVVVGLGALGGFIGGGFSPGNILDGATTPLISVGGMGFGLMDNVTVKTVGKTAGGADKAPEFVDGGELDIFGRTLRIESVRATLPAYDRETWYGACDYRAARRAELEFEAVEGLGYYHALSGGFFGDEAEPQVDHFVSVKEAHDSGGYAWDATRRGEFFCDTRSRPNDLEFDLFVVLPRADNEAKGALGIDWVFANSEFHQGCQAARRWVAVKSRYGLSVDPVEAVALWDIRLACFPV